MVGRTIQVAGGRIAVVAMLLLSGCWLQVGADGGHTRFNPVETALTRENVATLHHVWSRPLRGTLSEPVVSGGRVFVTDTTTDEARVRAFDVATGAPVWDQLLVGRPQGSELISLDAAPVAFVGDELRTGYSIELLRGSSEECTAASDVLDPATGARLGGAPGFPSAAVSSGPDVARNVTDPDGIGCPGLPTHVLEVSHRQPDGSVTTWRSAKAVDPFRNSEPTMTGDQVVVWGSATTVDSFAVGGCGAPTCMPTWTATLDALIGYISVPVAGATGPIFVLSGQNLIALDRGTGAELWRAPLGASGADLALANGTVYVTTGAGQGQLLVFDADGCGSTTCGPLWTAPLGSQTAAEPTIGGGVVYVMGGDGNLRAFDADGCGAATCSPLVTVFALASGRLSLAQGQLFLATGGMLLSFAPDASG